MGVDFMGPEQEKYKLDEVMASEALLLGRVTHEGFSAAWPERGGEFADKMNGMPKYVASTTLRDLEWTNSTLLEGEVADAVEELKAAGRWPHPRRRQLLPRAHGWRSTVSSTSTG